MFLVIQKSKDEFCLLPSFATTETSPAFIVYLDAELTPEVFTIANAPDLFYNPQQVCLPLFR